MSNATVPVVLDAFETLAVPGLAAANGDAVPAGPKNRAILLYSGDCKVCSGIAAWIRRHDDPKNGGFELIDERAIGYDEAAVKAIHPQLDLFELYTRVHLVMPDGTIKQGGEVVAEVLRRLPSMQWFSSWLFGVGVGQFRPFISLAELGYQTVDKLRGALGCGSCGTPVPWWGKPVEWVRKGLEALRAEK